MSQVPTLELDAASYPEWRDGIVAAELNGAAAPGEPRTYPGFPRWELERVRPRRFCSLDRALQYRRCVRDMSGGLPDRCVLSRLLQMSHGITGPMSSGPVPSAGGFQSLELYVVALEAGWLPAGLYHYDRKGHHLSQLSPHADRPEWASRVPSLAHVRGGGLLWVVVGDGKRLAPKYDQRSLRFLLQESGHLMQNLCVVSASLELSTVPLGGYFEGEIAREFKLLASDFVLNVGICGRQARGAPSED